jgi:KTSC domain
MTPPSELPDAWARPVPTRVPSPAVENLPTIELEHSKVIARLRYSEADRTLMVEFRSGAVYRYFGIRRDDYTKLATSASPGARFNESIQPYHESERLEDVAPSKAKPTPRLDPSTHL